MACSRASNDYSCKGTSTQKRAGHLVALAGGRFRGELDDFYCGFVNSVFLSATNNVANGLRAIELTQRPTRFAGLEALVEIGVGNGLWLIVAAHPVNAGGTKPDTPLPQMPPLPSRIGLDFRPEEVRFGRE